MTRLRTGASPRTRASTSANALLGTATATMSASSYGALVERHARGDEHVVAAVAEQTAEHPTPRARADDDESHERSRKSTTTGTPSRLKRSRSWFSTQYA